MVKNEVALDSLHVLTKVKVIQHLILTVASASILLQTAASPFILYADSMQNSSKQNSMTPKLENQLKDIKKK